MRVSGAGSLLTAVGTGLATAATVHSLINQRQLRRPPPRPPATTVPVSVLLPARDEAAQIVGCLRALSAQTGVELLEILVLDDDSRDDTARLVADCPDARVRLIDGAALPPGWLGKSHACAQLARAADPRAAVLAFVDADVRLDPSGLAGALAVLAGADLDVVCPYPRQRAETAAERLIQPLLQWSILSLLPLRPAERSPRSLLTAGNGQFLLVRRSAYERAGGHRGVRAEVLEDLALVRAVKRAGGRGGVVDGSGLAACRMYRGWADLRDGYGKSLWAAFGSPAGAAGVLGLLGLAYVVPPVAALLGSRRGLLGYLVAVGGRIVTARASAGRVWPDALAQPASILVFGYLTVRSLIEHRRGHLAWRGRPIT